MSKTDIHPTAAKPTETATAPIDRHATPEAHKAAPRPKLAPGHPGAPPHWSPGAKDGVGTALTPSINGTSLVWFTLGQGILNEVYYPRMDCACVRSLGLIVTGVGSFFSEEHGGADHHVETPIEGVPLYVMTSTCKQGRYRTEKTVYSHPEQNAVLQEVRFLPLAGALGDYRLFVVIHPHLGNTGSGNTAWIGQHKGTTMLFAQRQALALAVAGSTPWAAATAGFVGPSDGREDLKKHGRLTREYDRAEDGNVVLIGELDLVACGGRFVLALGFGPDSSEAAHRVRAALLDDGEVVREQYARGWRDWQAAIEPSRPPSGGGGRDLSRISAVVLRTSESKTIPGAIVASLSTPWGLVRGGPGDATEGYQLVWPRDLCEAAGGYLAVGATAEAVRVVRYLRSTQEADGHWTQNMQPDGVDYWLGIQVGETAFPIGLLDHLRREAAITGAETAAFRPMVRQAARYIVQAGPSTHQDRWENQEGYTPFTLSLVIASLLVAAEMADEEGGGESEAGAYLRETADAWNAAIESWLYVTGTDLARRVGVEGYYVRIVPPGFDDSTPRFGRLRFSGDPPVVNGVPVTEMVSPDALALVRFGLRRPDDPRILDTIKVIDAVLKSDLPTGPAWRRYNGDRYGEHADGSPYRTADRGIGRSWPLLTGERAHYELQAGRPEEALRLLHVMEAQAGDTGLIPEQIWDADDVPEKALFRGRPSGSAMPLVWAHAEYLKLRRSLRDGRICDQPPQTVRRYLEQKIGSHLAIWRFDQKRPSISSGETLRVEVLAAATIRWSTDDWKTSRDAPTRETPLGIHLVDLPTGKLKAGRTVRFTFHWKEPDHWEGTDFEVHVI